jgi:hypothetical protein
MASSEEKLPNLEDLDPNQNYSEKTLVGKINELVAKVNELEWRLIAAESAIGGTGGDD